ncbi:hypothetical protein V5799_013856 [Amblyomma americanum]|uniref:G-protein coupled receptors family 2 profile 2 domain-containing protein n=1 Tax=Amblyomma americanum TaxID=6943 RepID=A0AAQ4E4Q6_AMBAM
MRLSSAAVLCALATLLSDWSSLSAVVRAANATSEKDPPETGSEALKTLLNCSSHHFGKAGHAQQPICSTDPSCAVYEDCCFDAAVASNGTFKKNASCISAATDNAAVPEVMMVTRCDGAWPEDEVRKGCEDRDVKNETFHRIPVTSPAGYTYSNGFCALCNYDIESWVFWTASTSEGNKTHFELRDDSLKNKLRYCGENRNFSDTCERGGGNVSKETERKCKLYLEPVRHGGSSQLYKNAYCAVCNHVNLSSLSCEEVTKENASRSADFRTNKSSVKYNSVRKLKTNDTSCAAWFDGKCYINDTNYRYDNATGATSDESYTYTYQHYLIMVCIGLSLFFLLMKGLTYAIFSASRNFASRCNLCLSATLFFTQLVYILASYLDVPDDVCVVSSVFQHFGFVATFAWTTVLSFDMWRNISSMRVAARSDKTLILYGAIAWGVPLLLVAVCCVLNWVAPWSRYSPAYGQYYCFFGKHRPYIVFFLVPMGVLLAVDMGLYAHIIIYVRRTKDMRKGKGSKSGGNQPSDMALFFKLALIMGAAWFLGLLNFINSNVTQVLTSILNGLQGVYLFFGFQDYKYYVAALKSKDKRDKKLRSSTASNNSNASASTDVQSVSDVPVGSADASRQPGVKLPMSNLARTK